MAIGCALGLLTLYSLLRGMYLFMKNCMKDGKTLATSIRQQMSLLNWKFMFPTPFLARVLSIINLFSFAQARGDYATTKGWWQGSWLLIVLIILMAAGASSSRNGSWRGRGDERDGGDDYMGDDDDLDDDGEDDEEDGGTVMIERAPRSVSEGDLKNMPPPGAPKLGVAHFADGKFIVEAKYKKTLNGIVRNTWTKDTIHSRGKELLKFYVDVVEKFRNYYNYPEDVSQAKGDNAIIAHLRDNFRQMVHCEKNRANERVKKAHDAGHTHVTRHTYMPHYYSPGAWVSLCEHWNSDRFGKISKIASQIRKQLELPHRSGPIPFCIRRAAEKNGLVTDMEFFNRWFDNNNPRVQEIRALMERLVASQQTQETPEASSSEAPLTPAIQKALHRKREVAITVQAKPPRKGRPILHPRHTLSEIMGAKEARALMLGDSQRALTLANSQAQTSERSFDDAYSLMLRVMKEVTVLVNSLMNEVPRDYLEEQLQILATGAFPDRSNPAQAALWDQYVRMASDIAANLLETYHKVITEGTRPEKAPMEHPLFGDDDIDPDVGNYSLH